MAKPRPPAPVIVGARVRLEGQRPEFTVLEGPNRRGEWKIAAGAISIWAPQDKLTVLLGAALSRTPQRRSRLDGEGDQGTTVDLHGQTVREAIDNLELAIDRALRDDVSFLDVIHGIGTGALLDAVHVYLRKSRHVKRFAQLERNQGTTRAWL